MRIFLRVYDGTERVAEAQAPAPDEVVLEARGWRVKVGLRGGRFSATVLSRGEGGISVGIGLTFADAAECHLSIPAAVYDGNRFRRKPLPYPCILRDEEDLGADVPVTTALIPALPDIQFLAGDASLPAIGVATGGRTTWLIGAQRTPWGETGLEAKEIDGRLEVALLFPGVREGSVYGGGSDWRPSTDSAAQPEVGGSWETELLIDASDEPLYDRLFALRKALFRSTPFHELPFSAAWRLLEAKHNERYWNEAEGYYMLSDGSWEYGQWQSGWVGGGIQLYALAFSEDPVTRSRVRRMLDFVTGPAQAESGLFWSVGIGGRMDTDMVGMEWGHDWHLVRRTGDVLYFLLKTLDLLRRRGESIQPEWADGARRAAEALSAIWERHGQFGHFVSQFTGEIRSGATASGAIVPAALAHTGAWFGEPRFSEVAAASARYFVGAFLDQGFTNGGPGEAAQAPDSESAFALLESLVELADSDPAWWPDARRAAHLSASWTMPYDFVFPPESTFGRLGILTTGSVWANAQNKHSAPGICTLSGVSLLKLYRTTGEIGYLELMRDIAHGVTQYLSREDRPILGMPPGASCERVNTSDWEAPHTGVGEGFAVDCWSSISAMLTCVEIPGLYLRPRDRFAFPIDHIDVVRSFEENGEWALELANPTRFDAEVKVFIDREGPLGSSFLLNAPTVKVPAGRSVVVRTNPL